jgi:hypothetical protein
MAEVMEAHSPKASVFEDLFEPMAKDRSVKGLPLLVRRAGARDGGGGPLPLPLPLRITTIVVPAY